MTCVCYVEMVFLTLSKKKKKRWSFTFQFVDKVLLFMSDCGQLVSGHVDPPHQNSIIFAADLKKKKKKVSLPNVSD